MIALARIILILIVCQAVLPAFSQNLASEKRICVVRDNGQTACYNIAGFIDVFRIADDRNIADRIKQILEQASPEWATGRRNTLVLCSSGEFAVPEAGSIATARHPATSTNLERALEACRDRIASKLGITEAFGAPGGGSSAWSNAVASATGKMSTRMNQCRTNFMGGVASAGYGDLGFGIGSILYRTWESLRQVSVAKEQGSAGSRDALAGLPPQQPTTKLGLLTGYGRGYEITIRALEARCNNGHAESCEILRQIKESVPEPPQDPSPETPETPEEPKPTPTETSGDCIDEACGSFCEKQSEWWERFSNRCAQVSWKTYECASFVAMLNGCPDPALVRPSPDGDFECRRPLSEAERAKLAAIVRCEMQGKFYGIAGENRDVVCVDPYQFTQDVERWKNEVWSKKVCDRIIVDSGQCAPGFLITTPLPGNTPQPKPYERVVRPGDTLWSIGRATSGRGADWRVIYEANRAAIGPNPNRLRPGLVVSNPPLGSRELKLHVLP
jgi:nucleoid-associated protein YgaU